MHDSEALAELGVISSVVVVHSSVNVSVPSSSEWCICHSRVIDLETRAAGAKLQVASHSMSYVPSFATPLIPSVHVQP